MSNFIYVLLLVIAFLLGWGIRSVIFSPSKEEIVEKRELIIDEFIEHGDCHHDYDSGSPSYPGHDDVSYDLDHKGVENIQKILEGLL